jgi:hypothetical protein
VPATTATPCSADFASGTDKALPTPKSAKLREERHVYRTATPALFLLFFSGAALNHAKIRTAHTAPLKNK